MSYLETAKRVIFSPKQFFQELPLSGGYGEPIGFAVTSIVISSILNFVAKVAAGKLSFGATLIVALLSGVVGGIISIFIGFGIIHGLLKFFGAKKGFESTFRVGAYMTAFALLSWIPYVVYAVMLYVLYLEIVIFARVHEISTFRSFIAVTLIPIILLIMVLASGLSYLWVSSLQREVMMNAQNQIITSQNSETNIPMPGVSTKTTNNARISIDAVFKKDGQINAVLRNIGQVPISGSDIKAYVSGNPVTSSGCGQLGPSEVCTLVLGENFPSDGATASIRVVVGTSDAKYICYSTGKDYC